MLRSLSPLREFVDLRIEGKHAVTQLNEPYRVVPEPELAQLMVADLKEVRSDFLVVAQSKVTTLYHIHRVKSNHLSLSSEAVAELVIRDRDRTDKKGTISMLKLTRTRTRPTITIEKNLRVATMKILKPLVMARATKVSQLTQSRRSHCLLRVNGQDQNAVTKDTRPIKATLSGT